MCTAPATAARLNAAALLRPTAAPWVVGFMNWLSPIMALEAYTAVADLPGICPAGSLLIIRPVSRYEARQPQPGETYLPGVGHVYSMIQPGDNGQALAPLTFGLGWLAYWLSNVHWYGHPPRLVAANVPEWAENLTEPGLWLYAD